MSVVILTVAALGISSSLMLVSGKKMRSTSGSLELQAANYARQTLEELKNAVSMVPATKQDLDDTSYGASCSTAAGSPCDPTGTGTLKVKALPSGDLLSSGGVRQYRVWDISDGTGKVAYKKVTVSVTWNDPA